MLTRRHALYAGAALGALSFGRLSWPHAARAEKTYEVTHTDAEWQKILSPDAYQVLRHEGTERPFTSPLCTNIAPGRSPATAATCRSTRRRPNTTAAPAGRASGSRSITRSRNIKDTTFGMVRTAIAVPALRRPPRPRVQRRTAADRPALLHERRGAEIRAGNAEFASQRLYPLLQHIQVFLSPLCARPSPGAHVLEQLPARAFVFRKAGNDIVEQACTSP